MLLLIYAFTNALSTTGGEDPQPEQLNWWAWNMGVSDFQGIFIYKTCLFSLLSCPQNQPSYFSYSCSLLLFILSWIPWIKAGEWILSSAAMWISETTLASPSRPCCQDGLIILADTTSPHFMRTSCCCLAPLLHQHHPRTVQQFATFGRSLAATSFPYNVPAPLLLLQAAWSPFPPMSACVSFLFRERAQAQVRDGGVCLGGWQQERG